MIWLNLLHYIKDYLFQKDLRTSLRTIGWKTSKRRLKSQENFERTYDSSISWSMDYSSGRFWSQRQIL